MGVLTGIRVVEFEGRLAGSLMGMMLADQGADVIRIARPGVPINSQPGSNVLARGKRSVVCDFQKTADLDAALRLAVNADIVIENLRPGSLNRFELDHASLRARNRRLIHVRLPGFSSEDSEHADTAAYEDIIAARIGMFTDLNLVKPLFGMDPVYTPLAFPSIYGAVHGALAACAALYEREATGSGVSLEVPLAASAAMSMSSIYMEIEGLASRYVAPKLPWLVKTVALPLLKKSWARSPERQRKAYRKFRTAIPAMMDSYPCSDGRRIYIFAIDHSHLARNLLEALDLYDDAVDFGFVVKDPYSSPPAEPNLAATASLPKSAQAWLRRKIGEKLLTRGAEYWENHFAQAGVPAAIVRSTAEWMGWQPLHDAGILVRGPGDQSQPGRQFWSGNDPDDLVPAVPLRDADAILKSEAAQLPLPEPAIVEPKTAPWRALEGITVLDLTTMVAGPVAARTMAELGAEVIKIEAPRPRHGPRLTCLYGIDVNQGKASTLVNLKSPEGSELAAGLIRKADIVLHNMTPEAARALGLDANSIAQINPECIVCEITAYSGPRPSDLDNRHGYDPVLQAASGIMMRYGTADAPELHGIASCIDNLTGYSAAFGVLATLFARRRGMAERRVRTSLAQAATLIQFPLCVDEASDTASGQQALGSNPARRLIRTADGWVYVSVDDGDASEISEMAIDKMSSKSALATLHQAGFTAVEMLSVAQARKLSENGQHSFRTIEHSIGRLKVRQLQPDYVRADGMPLGDIPAAEKVGQSSILVAKSAGYSAQSIEDMIGRGIIATGLSEEYLP